MSFSTCYSLTPRNRRTPDKLCLATSLSMPIFEKQGQRLAFIHIPKAAGSSIERYFTDLGWVMSFYLPCTDPNDPADHHLTYSVLRERIPDLDTIPSFCVVRNPYRRIVSEWRWHRTVMRTTIISFPDFVRRMTVSLQTSQTYWDNHWRPQSDFLDDAIDYCYTLGESRHRVCCVPSKARIGPEY